MDAQTIDESLRLEQFASQLRSLQAHGRSATLGVGALCDALVDTLDLHLVFARVRTAAGSLHRDIVSINPHYSERIQTPALAAALEPWLERRPDAGSSLRYAPLGPEPLTITVLEFGSRSAPGMLIVGAVHPTFPDDLETLLLQAAADRVNISLLDEAERLALATATRDITERKRTELALVKAQQELAHAGRVLSMGELTASLAHEINQPLAAIVANANASRRWLERKAPNHERARESLENIARDAVRASDIIRRVRTFSSKGTRSRAPLNINNVIREVVALTAHEVERENVGLRTRLAEDLPAVMADRIELQQVMVNLVINSIEALRPVLDRPKDLCIASARHNKSMVEVSVADNGKGIEAQHLERMFDAFFTTKSQGMGLGLAISRRIVESHDGTLWATPNPERGLTLAFTLPMTRRRRR
jgi:C4-dicarboxylate-specific signal transduction histidine kinase